MRKKGLKRKNKLKKHASLLFVSFGFLSCLVISFFLLSNVTTVHQVFSNTITSPTPTFYCIGNKNCGSQDSFETTQNATTFNNKSNPCKNDQDEATVSATGFFDWIINLLRLLFGFGRPARPCTPAPVMPSPTPVIGILPTESMSPLPTSALSPTPVPTTSIPVPTTVTVPTVTPTPPAGGQTVSPAPEDGENYSGYSYNIATPAVNDTVQGTWLATPVTCSIKEIISPWIGMGDNPDAEVNLAQLGIDDDCTSGTVVYLPWTEALPADLIYYDNDKINAGDQITASVTYQGNGTFMTKMSDAQQGWTITLPMQYAANYVAQGGELIFEQAQDGNVTSDVLPDFSPITFTNAMFSLGSLTQLQPFSSGQGIKRFDMTHAKTSALNGTTFTVTNQ